MTEIAESRRSRSLLESLADELAWREGRWAAVARIAGGSAITVVIAMVFQIPQPTYMAYIVFLISKDERNATVKSAIGGLAAVTIAVILVLGLELIDTAEPALRLPLMALTTFAAMFTARTFALGPISFLAGFVVVLLQTLVDDLRSTEALTRVTLWIWVVIFVPVAVTVAINLLFGEESATLAKRSVRKVLREWEAAAIEGTYCKYLGGWRALLLPSLAIASDRKAKSGRLNASVIRALLDALVIAESLPDPLPAAFRAGLAMSLRSCLNAVESGDTAVQSDSAKLIAPHATGADLHPSMIALRGALHKVSSAVGSATPNPETAQPRESSKRLIAADALTNPAHWQFALKTTVAVMIAYASYALLDWPGMRTAVVTCFFVALSSLGETVHKLALRLSGAIIGGLIAALCIVFVVPHLTDVGQLFLLIFIVSACAAWISTSSELLAYAGMQIAFAFFLGILQGYAPATDLTVLRDRIAGIVLGNIVITIVFSSLWPQSARSSLREALARSLRAIAEVIRRPRTSEQARLDTVQALTRAENLRTLTAFELRMLPTHEQQSRTLPTIAAIEELAGAAFVLSSESISPEEPAATAALADWAMSAADRVNRGEPVPPAPSMSASHPSASDFSSRSAQRAIEHLQREADHVATATR
ncbi:MAG TPA: FUSC family protein [Steroidobacteraceae bacterium]|nr:FUSC family protein [Steroidobacteraceae bacterium]